MTRQLPGRASRRAVLGGLAVAATAAGCAVGTGPDEPAPDAAPRTSADPQPEPADDPDEQLVRRVVDDLTGALALVGGVARARGALARELVPWQELHAAHLEALEAPSRVRPLRVTGQAPALRVRVRREETALQRGLAAAAVAAESGALAALLATMAAGVAQRLAAGSTGGGR